MIDYFKINNALIYYTNQGFKYLDVKWDCPTEIARITTPQNCRLYILDKGQTLVGSAEQSFLDEIFNNNLKPGKYSALTPCFRDDMIDELHSRYFFKLELIDFENVTTVSLFEIIQTCLVFFKRYIDCEVIQISDESYDIVTSKNNIELGSYGIRNIEYNNKFLKMIYATGLAEPRLSKAIEKIK
jgi:hypothetical protein